MKNQFPLFQSHLDLAHTYWKQLVQSTDVVIDATCGNGHDTLMLAELASEGQIYAFDIQDQAIESAKALTKESLPNGVLDRITFLKQCHSVFPVKIRPATIKLIVYNLGYLPGGDKANTTRKETTVQSLTNAMDLLMPGGALSVTCYPGHPEGAQEEKAILELVSAWNPREWSCCHHRWLNRKASPSLLFVQKAR